MSKHAKNVYEPMDMDASKEINKLLKNHQPVSVRANTIDRAKDTLIQKDAPDFLRALDNPRYKNVIHKDTDGKPQKMM